MMSSDDWQNIPSLEGIGDEDMRRRVRERMEANAAIDREARAIFEEQGWERVNALGKQIVRANPKVRFMVDFGFVAGDLDGVLAILDKSARTAVREGKHDTAVMLRLLSISTSSCGPPVSDDLPDPRALGLANYLDGVRLDLPTHEDWEEANVDAALLDAEIDATFPGA